MEPETLPNHPAFLRVHGKDRDLLFRAAEYWEAPAGCRVAHQGDLAEDLIFVVSGRLETSGTPQTRGWMAGELLGEEFAAHPEVLNFHLDVVEDSGWLRWERKRLMALLASRPGLRRALEPLSDEQNRTVSGLGRELPGLGTGRRSRYIRSSLRPLGFSFVLMVLAAALLYLFPLNIKGLPESYPLAAPALWLGWLLVFLIKRFSSRYAYNGDAVVSRLFDWTRFVSESRHIPLDSIQGVEVVLDGLINRVLRTGSVIIKTSALDGELSIRGISEPEQLAEDIRTLRDMETVRSAGRERAVLRRSIEAVKTGILRPNLVIPAETPEKHRDDGEYRFRKSPAVLLGRLLLPLTLAACFYWVPPVLPIGIDADTLTVLRLGAFLPIIWALYRIEDWRNDHFQVTGAYVVDVYGKPLGLSETRRQVDLMSVQNIRTEQNGLAAVLFRFGDVILVTAGGAADTVFKGVARPWSVQETLFRRREEEAGRREEAAGHRRREELMRFAEAWDQTGAVRD